MESNVAFSDAVARARQIAAKLSTSSTPPAAPAANPNPLTGGLSDKGNPNNMPLGMKRPFPSSDGDGMNSKKMAPSEPDPITAQLRALADQQQQQQQNLNSAKDMAKLAAEQVAAKINAQMGGGGAGAPVAPVAAQPSAAPRQHAGLGLIVNEDYSVPNRMVGLVIGSKGETITQIQAQSGCRIQIDPDPAPGTAMENRHVSLNGSRESIEKAKELIQRTIKEAQQAGVIDNIPQVGGSSQKEMMIPASKVGLVIGKSGDMIKQLQARSGCKMVMVQDGIYANASEKPLKITGDPVSIDGACKIVQDLLDSKDNPSSEYGQYGQTESMPVPREAVGIIIGKGGDMIKTIQNKYSVKIQFQADTGGPQRMCDITGSPNDVFQAKQHVQELVQDSSSRAGGGGMRGGPPRAPNRGGFQGGPPRGDFNGSGGNFQDSTTMRVKSEKCGIVIGKGGDTIRQIMSMSGAFVELNRNAPQNQPEKEFNIRGTPDQIQHAMQLIAEKAQMPPPGRPGPPQHGGWGGPPQNGAPHYGGWGGPPGGPNSSGPGPYGGPQQQAGAWGNYNYNQWGQGSQQPPSGNSGDQQSNEQAWQAYYAQYYSQYPQQGSQQNSQQQQQQPQQQQQQPQQQQQQQQQTPSSAAPSQTANATSGAPTPTVNPATGQADYSEAWANYYRQMGWHDQADAILKQARGQQSGGGPEAPVGTS